MIHLDYAAVMKLADVSALVEPLRLAFAGITIAPERHHHELDVAGRPTLLLMPAWNPGKAIGVKVSTVFSDNPSRGLPSITGLYVLLSAENGSVSATIDGRALTLLRTAAVSALAAQRLAPPDAKSLLIVGTGALAPFLARGHVAMRQYSKVSIWGRDNAKALQVVRGLNATGIDANAVEELEPAVRKADVISCATNASHPLICGSWLRKTCHLDLVGSYKPSMREADEECLINSRVVVDTQDALLESGDLIGPLERKALDATQVDTLATVLRIAGHRPSGRTVFKSVGTGTADLAAAEFLFARFRGTLPR